MKKLLFSVYLLTITFSYGYSQSLSLSDSHGPLAPNTTIVQYGSTDSIELVTYLNVKNISNNLLRVLCKKTEIKLCDSTETNMCWAGGCYPGSTYVSPKSQPIDAGVTNREFSGHYLQIASHPFIPGESIVRWTFYDMSDSNDSVSVTIKYTIRSTGFEEANARRGWLSNIYPNPASGDAAFTYSMPAGLHGTIVIRDILGTSVKTAILPSSTGKVTISVLDLNDGIYFCTLLTNGKVNLTKKLVVKH
jgi:hypothetical protein